MGHPEIDVLAVKIALTLGKPAGGGVIQTGGIQRFEAVIGLVRPELTPPFVEDGVGDNTGVVVEVADGVLTVAQEELFPLVQALAVVMQLLDTDGGEGGVPEEGIIAAVDHILHDQHTQTVAGVVEILRFHLDVLAQQVQAQLFHASHIVFKLRGLGGEEDTVGEVALIQHAVEENRFAVETDSVHAVFVLNGDDAQGEIGLHLVLSSGNGNGVKIRIIGGPQVGVLHVHTTGVFVEMVLGSFQNDGKFVHTFHRNINTGQVGGNGEPPDMLLRDALQPDGLPDAADRGVPHSFGLVGLLAVGVIVGQGIDGFDLQVVFTAGDGVGDVKTEGKIAAFVATQEMIVEGHLRHLIHRTEMEQ